MKRRFLFTMIFIASLLCVGFKQQLQANPNSTPTFSRVYGDYFIDEVAQGPLLGSAGVLDATFGLLGSLSCNGQLSGSQARAVQVLPNGIILTALSKSSSDSFLVAYNYAGSVYSSFGSSGIVDLGSSTLVAQTMLVDMQGRILVAGGNDATSGTAGWLKRVSANGTSVVSFSGGTWRCITGLAQQSTGNIIAVGYDNSHAQIARYTVGTLTTAGQLDTTFGSSGIISFNGANDMPTITSGLYNVVVDANNLIYVAYIDSSKVKIARFTAAGFLDTTFGDDGIVVTTSLNSATTDQVRMALDVNNNLVIAAQVNSSLKIISIVSSTGATNSAFTTCTVSSPSNILDLRSLITTTDNTILLIGSNEGSVKSRVTRLTGAGVLDTTFNNVGYNEFSVGTPTTSSYIVGAAVSGDGRLYLAGSQTTGGVTTPYISSMYHDLYTSQVAQSPVIQEQGMLDTTFGTLEAYPGVVSPFDGVYGVMLMQKARSVIELTSRNLLVGMDGYLATSSNSNMMLARLTSAGLIDSTFGTAGKVALSSHQTNEYLLCVAEDSSANIYVAGYSMAGAIFRKYSSQGVEQWVGDINSSGYQGLDLILQGTTRVIVCTQVSSTTGRLSAHLLTTGAIDTTFHASGSTPGVILPTDFGLNMGPVFSGIANLDNIIFIAYKNSSTGGIDVAAIASNGSGLVTNFGNNGIVSNVFSSTSIIANNVRIAFDNNYNVVVAASTGTGLVATRLDGETGLMDSAFNSAGTIPGILTIPSVGTSISLQQTTGVSDGSILLTGYDSATDDTMLVVRINSLGIVDTTFNSQGVVPGIVPMKIGNRSATYTTRAILSLTLQSSTGNIVVCGYEQMASTDAMPMVIRLTGQPGTKKVQDSSVSATIPGTLDSSFSSNGSISLSSLVASGSAKVIYAYRSTDSNQGKLLVGIDTGSSIKIARVNALTMILDTTFGTAGILTISSLTGINHISIDANSKIIIAGVYSGQGWMKRLTTLGAIDVVASMPLNIAAVNHVYQQKSGRYIAACNDTSGNGVLVAWQDKLTGTNTTLQVDSTFNPLGSTPGQVTVSATGAYNLAINNDDTILVAYSSTTVKVSKYQANGASFIPSFGISGILNTTITPKNSSEIRLLVDSNSKVIIACSTGSAGTGMSIVRYLATGAADISFNSTGAIKTISNIGTAGVTLAHCMATNEVSGNDKIIALGYNSAGGNGRLFAVRLSSAGILDSTWNSSPTSPDTAGVLTYSIDSSTNMYAGTIAVNGSIYCCGLGTTNQPLVIRLIGDSYIVESEQQPFEAAAGTLDTTLDIITPGSGALNLNTALASTLGTPQKLYLYSTGGVLIAFNASGVTTLAKLTITGALDTTFNSTGMVILSNAAAINDMYVANGTNDEGSIYVAGMNSGTPWAAKISSSGVTTLFTIPNSLSMIAVSSIRKTTNGRILLAGQTSSSGIIVAYNAIGSALDTSFGNGLGYYATGMATGLNAIALDSYNRMYIAYKDTTTLTIKVKRIMSNGAGVDTTFAAGSIAQTNALSSSQIGIALDTTNQQVVVAVQDGTGTGNILKVARFSTINGSSSGAISTITLPSNILNLSNIFIDSAQNIYVVGYNATANYSVVARVVSASSTTIALDTTYAGTSGIANLATGSMTTVAASALGLDRRVYLVGNNGSTIPYLARVFGDAYNSQVSNALAKATPGTMDLSLDPNDATAVGGIVLSTLSNWSTLAGYSARAVQTNSDGTCYIAFGNGTNVVVGKIDADMNPVTSFGVNGLSSSQSMATINNMIVDAAGKVLVAGTQSGAQKVIRLTTSGALDVLFSTTLSSSVGTAIAEQKSGRILVGGLIGSTGAINAYQNTGTASAISFGPATLSGYYATNSTTQVDDFVVDGNDYIYFVYRNNLNHACVGKITANGSGFVTAFNTGSIIDTGIVASSTQPVHIAINNAGNILVAITTTSLVQTCLYNGVTGAVISSAQTILSTGSPIVTKLVGVNADFVGSAYTSASNMIAFRIVGSTGSLDTGFGLSSNGLGSFDPCSATGVYGITVQADGRIIMVGSNGSAPVIMRMYGYSYIAQTAQMPGRVVAGTIDPTLNPATGGALSPINLSLSGYAIKRLYGYSNGNMLFVCDNGTNTLIFRLLKDLTVDTSFNSPNGYVALPGYANVRGLYVNSKGAIFVAGGGLSTGWIVAYNANGSSLTGWSIPTNNLAQGAFQIGQQSSTRVIVAGQGSSAGSLYAYTPAGVLDTEFGTNGIVSTGIATPITGMFINSLDQIIIAYAGSSGTCVLQRVSADGATITTLNSGTAITGITNNEVRVISDVTGNIIVAAATATGFLLRRYTSSGVNNPSTAITIVAGGSSSSHLGNIYTTSDGKTVLVGYETTGSNLVVARLDANFALDSSFNSGAVLMTAVTSMNLAYDAFIHIDDRIVVAGGNSSASVPCIARVFGDSYVTYSSQGPSLGVAGVVDQTFGTSGAFTISSLGSGALNTTQAQTIVSLSDGGSYIALNNGTTSSKLIRMTAENSLNTIFGSGGIATDTLNGVYFMMLNGSGNLMLVGTTSTGIGWISRYKNDNSGVLDTTFNSSGTISFGSSTTANIVAEQTLARVIVAGVDSSGHGILRAFTNLGVVDTTFNPNSTPGTYSTGISSGIYAMAIDQFDRIIIAYKNGTAIDIVRLTSSGELDITFGTSGIISGALTNADQTSQVGVVLNAAGNIVVAAHITVSSVQKIAVKSFNNLSAASGNGAVVNAEYDITGLTGPTLTDLVATQDGNVIVMGTQSGTNPMWVARLLLSASSAIGLDTTFNATGTTPGIMTYAGSGVSTHTYNACAVRADGRLSIVGREDSNPTMIRAYNNPYIVGTTQCPNAKPIGSNDTTLGLTGSNGVTFFGIAGTSSAQGQIAQAIGLQDDNNILIALDGQVSGSTDNCMFLNLFDVDGLLNQNFGTAGKIELPHNYQSEYVKDLFMFNSAGVNKAIIVGYATNSTLNISGSLVMQYNVTSQVADSSFGGINGSPSGIVFGDGIQANVVGRQSMGRIIVSGTGLNGNDMLLGYTPTGVLDKSFGLGGYMTRGTNPIYTHVIDSMNRIVIAYNDGLNHVAVARILADGSAVDTTFGTNGFVTSVISGISGNSNMRVAIDDNGKIIVVAVNNLGTNYVINRYTSAGILDVSLTITSANLGTVTSLSIAKLLVDMDGKIILVGYDTNSTQNKIVIARTTATLSGLDTTFNTSQTPGYIKYIIASGISQIVTDAIIHSDGRILVVGSEN